METSIPSASTPARTRAVRLREFIPSDQLVQGAPTDDFVAIRPQECIDGLYFHVPFCFHKCHYCDFYSIVDRVDARSNRQHDFVNALIAEFDFRVSSTHLRPQTVFFGGGTPTLLRFELWQRLLMHLRRSGAMDDVIETTIEANPETVTQDLMHCLADGGINRVSIGVQTFNPKSLERLERWHDPASVHRAVDRVRQAGIENLSLDLIFAIPGQTLEMLQADLEQALALEPQHLSYYSLIFEPNTPLHEKLRQGKVQPVDESLERQMYQQVIQHLAASGFEHYEISNWARKGPCNTTAKYPHPMSTEVSGSMLLPRQDDPKTFRPNPLARRCLHNLLYWHNANWIGLGPAAASHVAGRRWKNQPHLGHYLADSTPPTTVDHEQLKPEQSIGERIMLGLRMREGICRTWIDSHVQPVSPRGQMIQQMIKAAVLEKTDTHIRLTDRGLFVADTVISQLL